MSKARDLANAGTALGAVSATELGYVDGVTSAIQTQIDSKIGSASAINPTIVDAKGDIIAATAADTVARLAVGANDTVLTADSTTATGLKWATPAAGGMTLLASGSLAASATGFDLTSISGSYNELCLYVTNYSTSATADIGVRVNNDTSTNYTYTFISTNDSTWQFGQNDNRFLITGSLNATQSGQSLYMTFPNYANTTGWKHTEWRATKNDNTLTTGSGFTKSTSAISRVMIYTTSGTFDSGTYQLFGVK